MAGPMRRQPPYEFVPDQLEEVTIMQSVSRNLLILAIGQALSSTVVSLLTSVSSLSGALLAPSSSLSTLPVTATVLGTLSMIYPASFIMQKLGRRGGFVFKSVVGLVGGLICVVALQTAIFALLILGTLLLGIFSAFSQYYRFAAIDAAPEPAKRTSAVAMVTGAGVVGGIAGPFLGGHFADLLPHARFAGAFIALCLVCLLLAASQSMLSADLGREAAAETTARQLVPKFRPRPEFLIASAICAIGFAVMTLMMNAAPLSMQICGIDLDRSSVVLQVHFALMYLPSLFNASLVARIGLPGLVATGVIANLAGCLLGLIAGPYFGFYVIELGLFGIGWNFMFNGGTLMLASTYAPSEKTKAQGINSLLVYGANVVASLLAGVLMAHYDWSIISLFCTPLLAASVFCLFWYYRSDLRIKHES
jgi:MFS family permease